jgi:hypothetical protein
MCVYVTKGRDGTVGQAEVLKPPRGAHARPQTTTPDGP